MGGLETAEAFEFPALGEGFEKSWGSNYTQHP